MKNKFYRLDKIDSKNAIYNMIFGERSNGKTYAVLEKILKNYVEKGKQGAYLRRWQDDFKGKRGQAVFESIVSNNIVSKLTKGIYNNIIYRSGAWYMCKRDVEIEVDIIDTKPFCYAFALSSMEHDKSTSYPDISIICLDEFLTRGTYLPDEFMLFMNTISTIIRYRDDVVIYMLGNTVNKVCPYFSEMGITHIKNMKQGDIDVYSYGDSNLKVAVEYANSTEKNKASNVYFAFDNPKLNMITGGAWEMAIYPHCPVKYKPKNIKFIFFIIFNGDILQCEIVKIEKSLFLFIHRKTTELQNTDKDLIYSPEFNAKRNYVRKINKPTTQIQTIIANLFMTDKVFYQDNEIGEIIRNYLQFCKNTRLV